MGWYLLLKRLGGLTRCDVRQLTRSGVVICILAWLDHLRAHPTRTDIVVVTGSDKGRVRHLRILIVGVSGRSGWWC